ncbi:MAG TPA: vanadium-dependent haloperoxidase [Microbacterium sp.]|nr:vanadium-dependent haloperoxidase [Microbacterium sp.]
MTLRRRRTLAAAIAAAVCIIAPAAVAAPSQAAPRVAADPAEIGKWHELAVRTIFPQYVPAVPAVPLHLSLVSTAMYNAVVTIEGGYEPYVEQPRAQAHASPEVAAVTAAYRVMSHYFPGTAETLAADYAASLADVPNGVGMVHGKRVGEAAAAAIIAERGDNGIDTTIKFTAEPAVGVWRPTPPLFQEMAVPWLGSVTPYTLDSTAHFSWPGPHPLNSDAYATDFNEVKDYGAAGSTVRSPIQTEIARFWNAPPPAQYMPALSAQVRDRGMDIEEAARAFAMLNTSAADSLRSCWRAKFDVALWRPITAIQLAAEDGNPATSADPNWAPLVANPPYSDYLSGHACYTGATSGALGHLFGPNSIDLDVSSGVTMTTRHFDTVAQLDTETMNARIWLGLHFRKAMTDGNALGHAAADWVAAHYFQPTD